MAEGQDAAKKINVTVKTPKTKETISVDENADIKEVSNATETYIGFGYVAISVINHFCEINWCFGWTHEPPISGGLFSDLSDLKKKKMGK